MDLVARWEGLQLETRNARLKLRIGLVLPFLKEEGKKKKKEPAAHDEVTRTRHAHARTQPKQNTSKQVPINGSEPVRTLYSGVLSGIIFLEILLFDKNYTEFIA